MLQMVAAVKATVLIKSMKRRLLRSFAEWHGRTHAISLKSSSCKR